MYVLTSIWGPYLYILATKKTLLFSFVMRQTRNRHCFKHVKFRDVPFWLANAGDLTFCTPKIAVSPGWCVLQKRRVSQSIMYSTRGILGRWDQVIDHMLFRFKTFSFFLLGVGFFHAPLMFSTFTSQAHVTDTQKWTKVLLVDHYPLSKRHTGFLCNAPKTPKHRCHEQLRNTSRKGGKRREKKEVKEAGGRENKENWGDASRCVHQCQERKIQESRQ